MEQCADEYLLIWSGDFANEAALEFRPGERSGLEYSSKLERLSIKKRLFKRKSLATKMQQKKAFRQPQRSCCAKSK